MCAVGIWAEVELDSRIMDKSSNINNFLDTVLNSQSASVRLAPSLLSHHSKDIFYLYLAGREFYS